MRSLEIQAERTYQVHLEQDWLPLLQSLMLGRNKVAIIISESNTSLIPEITADGSKVYRYSVPDGESGKSAIVAQRLWEHLHHDGFTRTDLIVGIGGGAVTDLAGFVAATWLRGVQWIAIPTTLAGMVDAAIGGKTGINTEHAKNLVGAFHSPVAVIIDSKWLETLSKRDFAAGLSEVIKCGFIRDPEILNLLKDHSLDSVILDKALTCELIYRSAKVKAEVVSSDFKESELREILNYGHTFGHAIESASKYSLRHGEAVAIGMIFVAELAVNSGIAEESLLSLHRSLLAAMELPVIVPDQLRNLQWSDLLTAMRSDKKARGDAIRFVIVSNPGSVTRLEEPDEANMKSAYEKVLP